MKGNAVAVAAPGGAVCSIKQTCTSGWSCTWLPTEPVAPFDDRDGCTAFEGLGGGNAGRAGTDDDDTRLGGDHGALLTRKFLSASPNLTLHAADHRLFGLHFKICSTLSCSNNGVRILVKIETDLA